MLDLTIKEESDALDHIVTFALQNSSCSWGAVIRNDDGSVKAITRRDRPCWGELRRYHDGTRPQDNHPGDIPNVIDAGLREAIAVPVYNIGRDEEEHNAFIGFLFGPEGPWRRGWKNPTFHYVDGRIRAVSMTETDVDPTVMVSALLNMRTPPASVETKFNEVPDEDKPVEYLLRVLLGSVHPYSLRNSSGEIEKVPAFGVNNISYSLSDQLSIKRFSEGDSLDLSNGRTWREQEDYNRPDISLIFGGKSGAAFTLHQKLIDRGFEEVNLPYYHLFKEEDRPAIIEALKEILNG